MSDDEIRTLQRELTALQAELASVSDELAPFRMTRKTVRESISSELYDLDHGRRIVKAWRCMTADELERWDRANDPFSRPHVRDLEMREKALKNGVRMAGIDLDRAYSGRRKVGAKSAQKSAPTTCQSLTGSAQSARPTASAQSRRAVGAPAADPGKVTGAGRDLFDALDGGE